MIRPNLLSLAAAAVFLSIASSEAASSISAAIWPLGVRRFAATTGATAGVSNAAKSIPSAVVDHYVEQAGLWDENRPIEHFLHEVTSRSWMRLEFMQWSFPGPNSGVIGAPVSGLQFVSPNNSIEGLTRRFW